MSDQDQDVPDWYADGFTSQREADDAHQREAEQEGERRALDAPAGIEDAVRARIAAEIAAYTDAVLDLIETRNGARLAFEEIARIARGES